LGCDQVYAGCDHGCSQSWRPRLSRLDPRAQLNCANADCVDCGVLFLS
jgi:hypothetical protein